MKDQRLHTRGRHQPAPSAAPVPFSPTAPPPTGVEEHNGAQTAELDQIHLHVPHLRDELDQHPFEDGFHSDRTGQLASHVQVIPEPDRVWVLD